MNDSRPEWGSAEHLAKVTAEELRYALSAQGIDVPYTDVDGDDVELTFATIGDAETMMTLVFDGVASPVTMYDRATSSCVSLAALGENASRGDVEAAIEAGWHWTIHPHMTGRRAGWHTTVAMPVGDAAAVTARLNEIRNGGAL